MSENGRILIVDDDPDFMIAYREFLTAEGYVVEAAPSNKEARRRFEEMERRGEPVDLDRVIEVIRRRDERDAGRADAPMKAADDAILLDTTNLDIEQAFDAAVGLIKRKIGQ